MEIFKIKLQRNASSEDKLKDAFLIKKLMCIYLENERRNLSEIISVTRRTKNSFK